MPWRGLSRFDFEAGLACRARGEDGDSVQVPRTGGVLSAKLPQGCRGRRGVPKD